MIDDLKESTGTALRLTSLAAAAAFALLVTTSFLCAALFIYMLQKYGPIEACLAGAGVFFLVTLIAAVCYMVRKNQIRARAEPPREKPPGKPRGRRSRRRRAYWPIRCCWPPAFRWFAPSASRS